MVISWVLGNWPRVGAPSPGHRRRARSEEVLSGYTSGSRVCSQSAIGIGAEYNIQTIHTGQHIRKCKAIALSSWNVVGWIFVKIPVFFSRVSILKRRKNGEVPKRNLRISLNIAAGGTGFLRHSSRIEHKFGRNSVLCELKRIQALPST